jgi:hypothetical protein
MVLFYRVRPKIYRPLPHASSALDQLTLQRALPRMWQAEESVICGFGAIAPPRRR